MINQEMMRKKAVKVYKVYRARVCNTLKKQYLCEQELVLSEETGRSKLIVERFLWQIEDIKIIKLIETIMTVSGLFTLVAMTYYQSIEDFTTYGSIFPSTLVCGRSFTTTNELGYFVVFWAAFIGLLMLLGNINRTNTRRF